MIEYRLNHEKILDRRAIKQPQPKLFNGGDCGACVLAGLFQKDTQWIYDELQGKVYPFSHITMDTALCKAYSLGLIDRRIRQCPEWRAEDFQLTWGNPSWLQDQHWAEYISMAIDAGYYGIAHINMNGNGPLELTDHLVLICGYKEEVIPVLDGKGGKYQHSVFVSCSARHPEGKWYEVSDFIKHYGGFNCHVLRPT